MLEIVVNGGTDMAITKYESYYQKILESLEQIEAEHEYGNESLAFVHWYLQNYLRYDLQRIAEVIIDGSGDKGIDVIDVDEENKKLVVMQFKFPSKASSINNEISEADMLKTWDGFETLIFNDRTYSGDNEKFKDYKESLKDMMINEFELHFVSYNKGILANRSELEDKGAKFKSDTGNELKLVYNNKDVIANIYERINRQNNVEISIKYTELSASYTIDERNINSYVGLVNAKELVDAISDKMAIIFDENIRLYENNSSVNLGIKRTAADCACSDMFYFYNNGVTFICDKAINSITARTISLKGASVVNGCQTLNSLYDIGNKLNDDVFLLMRVIEISDYSERMQITEYLNSQTPIKDSYFISSHTIVRGLQKQLIEKGYFLERQINEYDYKKAHGVVTDDKIVIPLEKTIQQYVGYWINKYASLAKGGKGGLFDKNKIDDFLQEITDDKVIEALNCYDEIAKVLTMYRKTRRNESKDEFSKYIGIEQQTLLSNIQDFLFMNTGDILLLNAVHNLKERYKELGLHQYTIQDLIVDSIFVTKEVIKDEERTNVSGLTKSARVFLSVQNKIKNLTGRAVKDI